MLNTGGVNLKDIKGDGWGAFDNLHEIMQNVGMLTRQIITRGIFATDTTLTGHKAFSTLDIVQSAKLSMGGYDVYVFGDCRIRSARIECERLFVFGNLTVERAVGDASYINILKAGSVYVAGNCTIKNTDWACKTKTEGAFQVIQGNFDIADSNIGDEAVPHGLASSTSANNNADDAIHVHVKGSADFTGVVDFETAVPAAGGYNKQAVGFQIRVDGNAALNGAGRLGPIGKDHTSSRAGGGGWLLLSVGGTMSSTSSFTLQADGGDATGGTYNGGDGANLDYYYDVLSGTLPTTDVTGGTSLGGTPGTAGTMTDHGAASLATGHCPTQPQLVTLDGAAASTLEFNVPEDKNASTLDFRVEIEEPLSPAIWMAAMDQNSNDNPAQFSGTPPYAEGTGSVIYTIPAGLTSGETYRWRVTAMKDADTTVKSIPSEWREFVMA